MSVAYPQLWPTMSADIAYLLFQTKFAPVENHCCTSYILTYIILIYYPLPSWKPSRLQKKILGLRWSWSSIRNIVNHQEKASNLYSRQKGRPSISWLNCLSMIAWLASFSTRASWKHFSQSLTLPTFRVKWKSSGLILSCNCLDSEVPN